MVQWRSWLIKIHISGVINLDIGHVIEKKNQSTTKHLDAFWAQVFNATFNNMSATCISWRSVLLVEETGISRKTTDLS